MAAISELNFDSISSFADAIKDALHAKATAAVDAKTQDMSGVSEVETEIDESFDEEDELELSFDTADLTEIVKIANDTGISYEVDSDEITITEEDSTKIDTFLDALDEAGISYEEDEVDEVDEGISKKRVHTSARDKASNKKSYRKNKGKLKIKAKRYRKTTKAKRLKKIGVRKAKQGKTATGRRIIKRV